jgi:hypothetical protein
MKAACVALAAALASLAPMPSPAAEVGVIRRDPAVDARAMHIARRLCPRCDPAEIAAAVDGMEVNEGPYLAEDVGLLARDALLNVRPRPTAHRR